MSNGQRGVSSLARLDFKYNLKVQDLRIIFIKAKGE